MKILVLNCGSSSIKYKLFDMTSGEVMAQGGIEKIGLPGAFLKLTDKDGKKVVIEREIPGHQEGIEFILSVLTDATYGCIKDYKEIDAVGHRVVHGGEEFASSVLINQDVINKVIECSDLAPLHNPANLKGVRAMEALIPGIPQVAVFDTAFHQTMPDYAYMYGLPYEMYKKYGRVVSPMGCRAFLSPWYERGGMHPADEDDKPIFEGRFNIGAVSLHLPMILAKAREEGKDFYEVLDFYLEMIRNIHKRTYEYLGEMKASTNPIAYCEGGFYGGHLKPSDKIKSLLKPMTASFGITALNELQELYNGKSIACIQ